MAQAYPKVNDDQSIEPIRAFDGARAHAAPAKRLETLRTRARRFREEMLAGPEALYYRSVGLIRVPYPTRYAFSGPFTTSSMVTPLVHILNRLFIVQYRTPEGVKTLLSSPSDIDANAKTPFFRRMAEGFGMLEDMATPVLAPVLGTVDQHLEQIGIAPEQIDYISFDHLYAQDLRRWLGTSEQPAFFPNAQLLVMRLEWEAAQHPLPPHRDWYCPQGLDGIDPERIVLLDGDTMLGDGVALIHTPGHTAGNHSMVVHTPAGLLVTSENGVAPDSYAPKESSITAVKEFALASDVEVVPNSNAPESVADQYLSMVQEKEIAGPNEEHPGFFNVVPSSELTSYWAFPGVTPSFNFGDLEYGTAERGT